MIWKSGRNNSPPGTGGVARSDGVVDGSNNSPSHSFFGIKENHFDFTTTPALWATPPVPGGELFFPLLQFIHTFTDLAYNRGRLPVVQILTTSGKLRYCPLLMFTGTKSELE